MVSSDTRIIYTATFEILLDRLITYLSDFAGEVEVISKIESVIERFERIVSVDPLAVSVSPSLSELGIVRFREFHVDNLRIVFQVHPTKNRLIVVDVIALQKQDLEELLIQYCLLYRR